MNLMNLADLFEQSRVNNLRSNISGFILKKGNSFFQIMEGYEAEVDELYAKVKKDPRHTDIIELYNNYIPTPVFLNFYTEYSTSDELDFRNTMPYLSNYLKKENCVSSKFFLNVLEHIMEE